MLRFRKLLSMISLVLASCALVLPVAAQDLPAEVIAWPDTIYTNAIVVTLDEHELNDDPGTIAEAMAIRDGKIQAIGSAEYIGRMRGPDTKVMDLAGKMVVPGFIESHTHPFALFDANLPEQELALPHITMGVMVEKTPDATYAKITRYAEEAGVRPGEWLLIELIPNPAVGIPTIWDIAEGWIGTRYPADQSFTKAGLTAALPNNPANAGIRNAREDDGFVRRHNSIEDVELLRQPSQPVVNNRTYDTDVADRLAHWNRYNQGLQGSHAFIVFNDLGWAKTAEYMPGLAETVTALRPDIENAGDRGILGTGSKKAWVEQILKKPYPTPVYAEAVKKGFTYMARSGITAFGSRVDFPHQLSAYHYLLRRDGRLPIRHAYTYEMHRNQLHTPYFVKNVYPFMGAHWSNGPNSGNPWLWNHGIGSEGAWDTPEIACLGPDLPGLPGMAEQAKKRERCDFLENRTPEVVGMHNALMAGWRIAGLHGVGSHGMRQFIQYVEEAIASGKISEQEVRDMRILMAHGTMVGKQPDVIAGLKRYNIIMPFQILRALTDEPPVIDTFYGPEGYEFLAPVKSLIDAGVRVAVETHSAGPPDLLFRHMPALVTRTAAGRTTTPEEGVDRVVALKMFTYSNAESMLAENYIGSLEPGKYADFTVLLNNWLEGPDSELGVNKVIMTVVGDEIIYEDRDVPWESGPTTAAR
jgi:predicted amidohydrolase YtcJ